jgi:hypothetical protein
LGTLPPMGRAINEVGRGVAHATSVEMRVAQCLSFPKIPSAGFLVEDLASIVKPGIFIVDDVALPTPITFLVLPGEKAVAAKLAGGGLGLASGGPRVGRLSETGSDNDDREGQSRDEHLHDTSPSIVHRRRRRRYQPFLHSLGK